MEGGILSVTGEGGIAYYNGRITSFALLSCITAAMGGITLGCDTGVSGGVTSMDSFLKKFFPDVYTKMEEETKVSNYCKFDSQLLTSFTSSLYAAGLIASFLASTVTRDFGRKTSILVGGGSFFIGSALGAAAFNVYILVLSRILLGVGVGFTNQSVPLYLSEISPPKYRGAISNIFQFSVTFGILVANLINYETEKIDGGWGWRISLGVAAIPAFIMTFGEVFLPETPNSLIQRTDDFQNAKQMLQKLRGTEDVQAELDDLIKANDFSKSIKHPFKKIMQREYRPQLVMSIAIPFFQQVTGINVIYFYAPILIRSIGLKERSSLLSVVVAAAVSMFTTFISVLVVDKLGRRFMFAVGGILMFISQITIGTIMAVKLRDHGGLSQEYALLLLLMICIYVAAYGLSWGPLGWLVPSEIFPLEIRPAGQSITVAVNFLFTFIVAQTSLAMFCHFKAGIFFFFGGWVAVMTIFVYAFLPETQNVPIEQMGRIWRIHWFWKRITDTGHASVASEKEESLLRQN